MERAAKISRSSWESLPEELIGCIIDKLEGDFVAISSVRGVSKHWRASSHVLTTFKTSFNQCKNHDYLDGYLISMADFISKAKYLRKLTIVEDPQVLLIALTRGSIANELLEACDWSHLSKSLHTLDICTLFGHVSNTVSNCRSLSELRIVNLSPDPVGFSLPFQVVERLKRLDLSDIIDPEWLACLPHLPYIEELKICCELRLARASHNEDTELTVTLSTPKLRDLDMRFPGGVLNVEAPLIQSIHVTGIERLHVLGALELKSMILGPGIILIDGPRCLKKLAIKGKCLSLMHLSKSLSCLRAVPWITSLTIEIESPFLLDSDENESIVDIFVREFGQLTALAELEMNLHMIYLLKGVGSLANLVPNLNVMIVNMFPANIDSILGTTDAFGDRIVEILEELELVSLKTKNLSFGDPIVRAKVEQYLININTNDNAKEE